jgi:uncharacterized protein (TIGR00730 family)
MNIQSVAVFCGSQFGANPLYLEHTIELGKHIAALKLKLVYGGGRKGLMGAIADSVLESGGVVMGVIPKILTDFEHQHTGLTELTVVPDMHSRKRMMYDLSDAAIILPGGYGTLDEMFEMLTWNQLKIHNKKIYLLNSAGFYDRLIDHLRFLEKENFLYEPVEQRIVICNTPAELLSGINNE